MRALGEKKKTRLDYILCLDKKKKKRAKKSATVVEEKKGEYLNKDEKDEKQFGGMPHAKTLSREEIDSADDHVGPSR